MNRSYQLLICAQSFIFTAVKGTASVKEKYSYINELAAQNVPFLCLIDFEGIDVRVWPLHEIDPHQIRFQIRNYIRKQCQILL